MNLREIRKKAISELREIENNSPNADVDFLLTRLLNLSKTEIIIGERKLSSEEIKSLEDGLARLKNGEPVQYVAGACEFMSLDFCVDFATLIPRADTEILVETVIDFCRENNKKTILEIGCGSGCIAVSLAYYLKETEIIALDISEDALKTAKKNAQRLGVSDRVHFLKHDIMKGFPENIGNVDVVVSNPPYIPSREIVELEKKVRAFEPRGALDGGEDGLDFYRRISECVRLKNGGMLAFEVGYNQANDVLEIMKHCGYKDIRTVKDLSGIDRVVTGRNALHLNPISHIVRLHSNASI